MSASELTNSVARIVLSSLSAFVAFLPSLVGGLIVLIIGLVIAAVVYRVVVGVFKSLQLEKFLAKYGLTRVEGRDIEWSELLGELLRWSIILIFLIPTLDVWRLGSVNVILNRLILFIPNVIVAVVLALIGLVIAKLAYRVASNAARTLGKDLANTVGLVGQWAVIIFVGFLILDQLGVARDLLRILFGGIVAMIAVAGGIAFGLGGQGTAKDLLEGVLRKWKK